MSKLNILYLHSHDTGRFIQPYGHPVPTPNMQRFADDASVFRNCFCAGPTCSASRSALLTGQWPHVNGMIGLAHRGFKLNNPSQTLMNHIAANGYQTVLAAVQHIVHGGSEVLNQAGWHTLLPRPANRQSEANEAVKYLLNKPQEPFFLDVGFIDTHLPFNPAPHSAASKLTPPPFLPDSPETRQDYADYCSSAAQLDLHVGRILGALEASGLADNTIILITTDHGIPFPNAKCNLTDSGMGVLCMLRLPKSLGLQPPAIIDGMISHVDLFPTLCELTGLPLPSWQLHGTSLIPLLSSEKSEIRDELFCEVTYHAAYEPQRAIRTNRYKYIKRFDGRTDRVMPNCDDSRSKTYLVERGWAHWNILPEYLYDLIQDPWEKKNLIADPAHSTIAADLRARLNNWMRQTSDPLLDGQVPAPSGAIINDVNGQSPNDPTLTVP